MVNCFPLSIFFCLVCSYLQWKMPKTACGSHLHCIVKLALRWMSVVDLYHSMWCSAHNGHCCTGTTNKGQDASSIQDVPGSRFIENLSGDFELTMCIMCVTCTYEYFSTHGSVPLCHLLELCPYVYRPWWRSVRSSPWHMKVWWTKKHHKK